MQVKANESAKQREIDAAKARLQKIAKAGQLFEKNTFPLYADAPNGDFFEWYFLKRDICLRDIAFLNKETMRFSLATEYWKGTKWENGKPTRDNPKFPAIHSAFRGATGVVTA
ncbi:MAG: hypothetical protein U5K75_00295 [Ahrensia sp.]|nr:hypothetical protein [Ahrensia sp.]